MIEKKLIENVKSEVLRRLKEKTGNVQIQEPFTAVGVSNRHVHLRKEDLEALFGKGYKLNKLKDLKQPGQFAAKETVMLIGPEGIIENVRILGPLRSKTQVEVSLTDSYKLGIKAPVRESGDIEGTPGIVIKGPTGVIEIKKGVIVAKRHIHMSLEFANQFGFRDKEVASVQFDGVRSLVFDNVLVRVSDQFVNEMHLDTDEANAGNIKNGDIGKILKGQG
ncbi:phosphate propanoyltransferase [Thermoactinomyces sp. AMNI-1]|uniref:Phosphate propanoyltransferase n=1 Tax=Thermoactinomyces mirandus TaxID=2756294 RepID=A0A7W1XU33_9BACL|nr:phosphate propanoyltransferase [Thermoactinomyces mirandus]MBA4603266.1 phosphate propanoyltransferase [Thermoactinomyces mirandus]